MGGSGSRVAVLTGVATPTPVRHAPETGSTSVDARTAFEREGVRGPLWFTADLQTAGTGRRGRSWVHHPGNFAGTLLLPVERDQLRHAPVFAFIAALGVAEAVTDAGATASEVMVKWPNDVLLRGRKLAGILSELLTAGAEHAISIGIGVNLTAAPGEDVATAISLAGASDRSPPDPVIFRESLDRALVTWWQRFRDEGFAPVREAWLARAAGLGGPITVRLHDQTREGIFAGIDEDGALLLGLPGGTERVTAADVFLGPGRV
ncbi:MAG: biotin--[acetyl-CoA-carboxylase] ligase [Pseudomonadota bacterium]